MLRNIALTAAALAFCLLMFVYLLNAPERPPQTAQVALPVASTATAITVTPPTATAITPAQVAAVAVEPSPVAPTVQPSPVETQIALIFEENNRGLDVPVKVSRMMDTITVRWALSDRETDAMLAEADRRIGEALPVLGDEYRLINFEGTFGLIHADGRRSEDVVLWVTYEDGREVSRKVAPVLMGE